MDDKNPQSKDDFLNTLRKNAGVSIKERKELNKMLDRAYKIRDLELDLYWKRATYFWTFIAAIFLAFYMVTINKADIFDSKTLLFYKFCIICIGLVFTLGWYLVNRGSTYWTTNWERIIDALETRLGHELYKLNLKNENDIHDFGKHYSHSVSRINIAISFFFFLAWLGLFTDTVSDYHAEYCLCSFYKNPLSEYKFFVPLLATITISLYLFYGTVSKLKSGDNGEYSFIKRDSEYDENIPKT